MAAAPVPTGTDPRGSTASHNLPLPASLFSPWSRRVLATSWHRMLRFPMSVARCCSKATSQLPPRDYRCSSRQGTGRPSDDGTGDRSRRPYAVSIDAVEDHRNVSPVDHTRCMMTAILRATATAAFFIPLRLAIRRPQALSADHFSTRVNNVVAASNR